MKLRIFLTIVVSIIMLISIPVITSCAKTTTPATTAATTTTSATTATTPLVQKTLAIGASIPLTGPPSAAGIAFKAGWQLAFDQVNEAGGIKIGNTIYKIQFMAEDSQASAEGGATAATKLCLQEGVKFVMGDIADFMIPPIYKITSQAGALFFMSLPINAKDIPGNVAEVGPDKPLLIRAAPASSEIDILPAQYLVKNYPNAKSVALVALNFPDYDSYKDVLTTKWAPLGLKISDYERIGTDDVDFMPMMSRLLATKPDAIDLMRTAMSQFPMIIKTARDQGFTGPIMYAMPTDIAYAALAGPNISDVFGTGLAMDDPNLPQATKDAIALGRAKLGKDFVSDSLTAYDQAMLLVQMIQKAQSIDPMDVQKTFETLTNPGDLQSIFGPAHAGGLKTTGVNHVLVKPWPMALMMNGKGQSLGMFTVDVP
jgi:branched-chain amino acid transport system substrate-binding protein